MAHAASTPNLHVQIFIKTLHRIGDGFAEVEAALSRGHGVLHHVHGEWNDGTRPGWRLTAHQRQRHGQAMVHVHFVDDGQVKVLLDDGLRNVRGQRGVALHHGHGAWAPALVGRRVLCRCANGECGNHVQAEGRGVVVVYQENHIRSVVLHPLLRELVAFEQRLPIGLGCFTHVDGRANGGHVRGVNGCADACHVQAFPAWPWGCRWAWASPSSPM